MQPARTATRTYVASIAALTIAAILSTSSTARPDGKWRERLEKMKSGGSDKTALPAKTTRITGPGLYRHTLSHEGRTREYLVYVPPSWRKGASLPIVLALHGGGGDADYMANNKMYGLIGKAQSAGFIAVFPNGISPHASGMLATWNAGTCCGGARDQNVDDVGFLKTVSARVVAEAGADASRVFAIGMSNGGLMAYRLACDAPEFLRGIMSVAGTDNTKTCTPSKPLPILHIHAKNDDHVLYNGGAGASPFGKRAVTDFVSVPATIDKWVQLNRANTSARTVLSVPGATCTRHDAMAGGAPVQLCVTETGAHSWPGGTKQRASEPPSTAIIANDVMWDFFKSL
jgi:polyhydroxybutyrate depolymerase